MNYKSHLILNYEKLYRIKHMLEIGDNNYFTTTTINETTLDAHTISIVMTACDRSIQTYFTIETIAKSMYKNIQVILVDDSLLDFVSVEKLEKYNIHIDLIHIKNKFWINPCINYNIGFKHIRGSKVIIQNAEVCHIGDVINYVATNINNDEYHVLNVYALKGPNENNLLYDIGPMIFDNHQKIISINGDWYQHPIHRNAHYHFLTATTKETFDKIGGFDIDYALGVSWDDDSLVFKITNSDIKMVNPNSIMGIHQWHPQTNSGHHSNNFQNLHLYNCKCAYYKINKTFLDLTSYDKNEILDIINKWI